MKTSLIIFITFIVTILLTSSLLALYVMKQNPFNIQACVISSFFSDSSDKNKETNTNQPSQSSNNIDHPLLSTEQEQMLDNAGIDVEAIPTTISAEMEDCFVEALGEQRVNEIMNGNTPGPLEILKARSCL